MARSEEAILRRALKRERTEGQQRNADRNDMNRQTVELNQKVRTESDSNKRSRVSKPISRNQKKDGMNNSTSNLNSTIVAARSSEGANTNTDDKTYDQVRPSQPFRQDRRDAGPYNTRIPRPSERRGRKLPPSLRMTKKKQSRHNEETSKKLSWGRQADSKTLSKNQELRQRYQETGGEGMNAEDLERAKLLMARQQRKEERKKKKSQKVEPNETMAEVPIIPSGITEKGNNALTQKNKAISEEETAQKDATQISMKGKKSSEAQARRDQNKAIRLLYLKTDGKGMKEDQIERAKSLIARDEKKLKRRTQKEAGKIE